MFLATLSYSKFEIIQLLREESAPNSTVIKNMGVGGIFTGGGHWRIFPEVAMKIISREEPKVVKFHSSFSKLRKRPFCSKCY